MGFFSEKNIFGSKIRNSRPKKTQPFLIGINDLIYTQAVATERMRSETAAVSEPVYDYSYGKHRSQAPIKSLIQIKDSRFVYKDADNKSLVVVEGTQP